MINYIDNFLTKQEHKAVYNYCLSAPYYYGEIDYLGHEPTGMASNINGNEYIYKLLKRKTLETFEFLKPLNLYRMYVNCFAPGEQPNYHIDGDQGYTLLYYPNLEWSLNDGGSTEFNLDDQLQGIHPVPNRIAIFDANILHRATSFRNRHRFTVAIKYI
jgi:Rps23 Pro-64 3,4-dihydroxylase Tpa1-like proline 4-hydroxylase